MSAPLSSPIGGCGEDPAGRGARIRTVIDTAPSVGVHACFEVIGDRHLCFRCRGHIGGHLPLPRRWPSMDITRENPRYVRSAA